MSIFTLPFLSVESAKFLLMVSRSAALSPTPNESPSMPSGPLSFGSRGDVVDEIVHLLRRDERVEGHLLAGARVEGVDGRAVRGVRAAGATWARRSAGDERRVRVGAEGPKGRAALEAGWAEDEYEELQQRALQERLGLLDAQRPRPRARRLAVLQGFSLHADTAVHGQDRQGLERLCRYWARGPVAESRLRRLEDGRYQYAPKKGVTFTLTAEALVRRLVALVPPPRRHLTSFHGVFAPHAALRPLVTQPLESPPAPAPMAAPAKKPKRHLDWATLHQRTWGTDVLRCPCGGRRSIRSLHASRGAVLIIALRAS